MEWEGSSDQYRSFDSVSLYQNDLERKQIKSPTYEIFYQKDRLDHCYFVSLRGICYSSDENELYCVGKVTQIVTNL